jgi:hypothetical protein
MPANNPTKVISQSTQTGQTALITTKLSQAQSVPTVPGPRRERPLPNPKAKTWAGCCNQI